MMCVVVARAAFNPPFLNGYFGNCFAIPAAIATTRELCGNPLEYAVKLVKEAKGEVNEEYVHLVADLMVKKGRHLFTVVWSCVVFDTMEARFRDFDFGWGKAVYGGPAKARARSFSAINFRLPSQNEKGEEGILVLTCLPDKVMEIFAEELDENMLDNKKTKKI